MKSDKGIDKLFIELIRIALGNGECLSHLPTPDEWHKLFGIAQKQSLVGICFAGVKKLQQQNLPEGLYQMWLGMAAMIQLRNETVNRQCAELQRRLSADGERFCVMKGQGAGLRYSKGLDMLRQSGDIDVWIAGGMKHVVEYANRIVPTNEITSNHVQLNVFEDTDVELHYVPVRLGNRWVNRRLKAWLRSQEEMQMGHSVPFGDGVLNVPTDEFDTVYLLLHIYKHLFNEGIGLRQLMDYYFLLKSLKFNLDLNLNFDLNVNKTLKELGVLKFAAAVMYVEREVFGLKDEYMICKPDEKAGSFLLEEILQMGNFGQDDKRFQLKQEDSHIKRFWQTSTSKWRFIDHFPNEAVWQPIDTFLRFFELRYLRRRVGRMKK